MASSNPGTSSAYFVLAVLIVLIIRRMTMVMRGSKVNVTRSVVFSVYYLALAGVVVVPSLLSGLSPLLSILYLAVGLVAVRQSYRFADRRIVFWRRTDGSVCMKGAVVIYVIYVVGLIARISIGIAFLGSPLSFAAPTVMPLGSATVYAEIATDLLVTLGVGLLIGRNARVIKRYNMIAQGREQIPDSPPADSGKKAVRDGRGSGKEDSTRGP